MIFLPMNTSSTCTCTMRERDATRAVLIAPKLKCFELILSERLSAVSAKG